MCPKYLKTAKSAVCKSLNWESLDPLKPKGSAPIQSTTESKKVSQKTDLHLTANGEIPDGVIVEVSSCPSKLAATEAIKQQRKHQQAVQKSSHVQKSSNVFNQHNPTEKVTQIALQIHKKVISAAEPVSEPASSPEPIVKVESPLSSITSPQGGKRMRVQSRKARESKSLEKELEGGEQRKKSGEGEAEAVKEVKRECYNLNLSNLVNL